MSSDLPDDFDDLPPRRLPPPDVDDPDRDLRRDYRDEPPPRKPGFGFWMAVLWSLLYFVVTQIIAGVAFAILFYGIALVPEIRANGMGVIEDPNKFNAWIQGPEARVATICLVGATQVTGLVLSWILLRANVGRSWKQQIALTRLPSATHVVLVVIGMPALLALGAAIEVPIREYVPSLQQVLDAIGIHLPGLEGTDEMIGKLIGESPWPLALFVVGVTPAICEEVFCRGFLAWGLSHRYRTWAVVLIVSFLFGCLHGDPRQGLGAMCLGAAIHGAYLATRSLWAAVLVHWANNSIGVIHMHPKLPKVLDLYERLMNDAPILFVAAGALLFAAVCYALYQTRCRLASTDPAVPAWQPWGISGVKLPPAGSTTVVTHDPISPVSVGLILTASVAFGLVLALA